MKAGIVQASKFDKEISTPWLVFDISGQWCLLALLVTLAFAKRLSQRHNPFLINFLLTTFLATIPPSFLLYGHKQHGKASDNLCFVQAALIDGSVFMFSIAQLMLVFDTWSELRNSCLHKPHISRETLTKYILLAVPYIAFCIASFASFSAAFNSRPSRLDGFAYCILLSRASGEMRQAVGLFVGIVTLVGLFFELWVCWMIYAYPAKATKDPLTWRTNIQFSIRVLIYASISFIVVVFSIINLGFHSSQVKAAYQLLDSMNALFVFLVFGTQKSILRVWTSLFHRRSYGGTDEQEMQPQAYPVLDWAEIPVRKPPQFNGEGLENEEEGQPRPRQNIKGWFWRGS